MTRFLPRHSLKLWLFLAFLAPMLVIAVRHLQFSNAVEKWLPQDSPEARTFEWYQEAFGHDEFVLVTWENSSLEDSRIEFVATLLESHPEVARCQTPGRLIEQMTALDIPRSEAIHRLEGVLLGPGGSPAGIAVVLSPEGSKDREATISLIRSVASEQAAIRYHPTDESQNELHLGGAPAVNSELDVWSRDSLRRLLPLATAVCVALTFVSLRSLRLGLLVLATSYYSVLAAMAMVGGTGASLNLLMVIIPSLVMVVGLSGSIHLVNYWRYAARDDAENSVARAWSMAWRPCVFACVTTAIGLGSLATSRIGPVRQFGIYAGIGVLLTLAFVLFALPAGLQMLGVRKRNRSGPEQESVGKHSQSNGRHPAARDVPSSWQRYASWISTRSVPVATACLVLFAVAAIGLTRSRTEVRPIRYFPTDSRIVRDYAWIENNLGGTVPVETILRFRGEEVEMDSLARLRLVRAIEQKIKELPKVSGTLSLASLSPTFPNANIFLGSRALVNATLKQGIAARRAQISTLFVDSKEAGGEQLWRITALTKSLGKIDYADFVKQIESLVPGVIRDFPESPGAPDVLKVEFTGLVPLVMHAQHEVLRGLVISFVVAFAIIGLIIVVLLRSPGAGVVAMVPNLTPVVAVFGVLGWANIPIDIGTMMTASVALGIAVDGTLHLLTWFSRGMREGMPRKEAIGLALVQAGPAIVKTSLIAGLGLMVLGASPFLPTQRFGLLMAGLLGAAMVGGIVLLPALLASPVGRIFEGAAPIEESIPQSLHGRRDAGESVVRPVAAEFYAEPIESSTILRTSHRTPPES